MVENWVALPPSGQTPIIYFAAYFFPYVVLAKQVFRVLENCALAKKQNLSQTKIKH